MKSPDFLYIANWKMQLHFEKALSFCWEHKEEFEQLSASKKHHIILCPSFDALHLVAQLFKDSSLSVGAQTCSKHKIGAYTGEVSAASLSQVGCEFCIVGHSERRIYFGETDNDVSLKTGQLLENGLHPIICVGETQEERKQGKTEEVVARQVHAVCQSIKQKNPNSEFCIAYEPVWAIGTEVFPSNKDIEVVLKHIQKIIADFLPEASVSLIYGGSVNAESAKNIKQVSLIKGFLIGGASFDFQKFEKIVT